MPRTLPCCGKRPSSAAHRPRAPSHPAPTPAFSQELGIQILADLQRQRETIVHSRDALAGIDENVSRSRQILASMSRRILQNKLLMWGVVALLVLGVLLVAWAKH